jgi:hypothetical protein
VAEAAGGRLSVMSTLQDAIDRLGTELVLCPDSCAGIWRDPSKGILPRSLFLERPDAPGRGSLAIGLNPGTSKGHERAFYLDSEISYDRVKAYRLLIASIPYFERARSIIDQLGLSGPILWSNLAKCENESGRNGLPPLQTLRHCTRRFLSRELTAMPADWAVLALGREAYRALAYLVPERTVIGIPHPTGGFRDFRKMLEHGQLRKEIGDRAARHLASLSRAQYGWVPKRALPSNGETHRHRPHRGAARVRQLRRGGGGEPLPARLRRWESDSAPCRRTPGMRPGTSCVLRQASQPLAPMGAEWLKRQERNL